MQHHGCRLAEVIGAAVTHKDVARAQHAHAQADVVTDGGQASALFSQALKRIVHFKISRV